MHVSSEVMERKTVDSYCYIIFQKARIFMLYHVLNNIKSNFNPIWTGGIRPPPLRFFLHNSKTPGDIEKKLSDFNFTPLMDILHILSITIVVRCRHSNLLFPVCHVIFWVENTKKLELFSR